MEIKEIWSVVNSIESTVTKNECEFLFSLARNCQGRGVIVEIGSYKGRSTATLALGSLTGAKSPIFAIDPQIEIPRASDALHVVLKKHLEILNVAQIVTLIKDFSQNIVTSWQAPIELLFIDGDHEYESVKRDFYDWYPHIITNGVVAFHDTCHDQLPGPHRLVQELKGTKLLNSWILIDSLSAGVK